MPAPGGLSSSASAASGVAPSAEPALNPNQPNQSSPAPSKVNGTLCGRKACLRVVAAAGRGPSRRRMRLRRRSHGRRCRRRSRARPAWPGIHHPRPSGRRAVDDQRPEREKQQVGVEPHPLDNRTGDERHGDDGERALVGHEEDVWNRTLRLEAHVPEQQVAQAADVRRAGSEGQRVASQGPDKPDGAQRRRSSSSSCSARSLIGRARRRRTRAPAS